jgi:long-chain fatty acid adenylyltransferase FadD28
MRYWGKPQETEETFRVKLVAPLAGTPEEPSVRTGDLGFLSDGESFIMGRLKDLLIVYGRNHSPDDVEATIQEITRGRCAALAGRRILAVVATRPVASGSARPC